MAILKKIFGIRRDEAWRQFSEGINRKHIEGRFPYKEIRIEIKHMAWGFYCELK